MAASVCAAGPATTPADDDPLTSPRTAWFREARFGMFIHWGIYSVPAGEWQGKQVPGIAEWIMHRAKIPVAEYEKFAAQFNPAKFDARQWVVVAKAAGMKYLVITSKHHDGFSMFDSKLTGYDIVDATPYKKDVMKDLAAECEKAGIRFCFYHSILDWHHPDQPNQTISPKYIEYMKGQVRELLTQYGKIGILWFDGEWAKGWNNELGRELYAYCRQLQPDLIVNERVGKRTPGVGDYATPEQKIPGAAMKGRLWETCMTMNGTWGYSKFDNNWKSPTDLVQKLCDIASKGGNFLLNVGPTAEGLIPQPSVDRLGEVGKWLAVNGEAIYGTSAGPYAHIDVKSLPFDGRCTLKGNVLYVHVFNWTDGRVKLPDIKGEIANVSALDPQLTGLTHQAKVEDGRPVIVLESPKSKSPHATVLAIRFAQPPVYVGK
jgi:alpha-L-fucosidase